MLITVLTTTYNRSYCLDVLYQSLRRQTCKDFEWIIIDDGSTDNTRELCCEWIDSTTEFDIVYKYVKNGGKHRGLNIGTALARGEAIINVDSDDYLADDAISFVSERFPEVRNDDRYAGIAGLKAFIDGSVIGGNPPYENYVDANSYEYDVHIHVGDKAEAYKTSVLRKYPFPVYPDENFMSEGAVFFRIAYDGYLVRWYNKVLEYCEYLPDGLTRNSYLLMKKNPYGWAEYMKSRNLFGEDIREQAKRRFFVLMKDIFGIEELCKLLMISVEEYSQYEEDYNSFVKKIKDLFEEADIRSVALYGCGKNAQFFAEIIEKSGAEVVYGIDRNPEMNTFDKVYSMKDSLPDVDAVFITPSNMDNNTINNISNNILELLPQSKVFALNKIDNRFF